MGEKCEILVLENCFQAHVDMNRRKYTKRTKGIPGVLVKVCIELCERMESLPVFLILAILAYVQVICRCGFNLMSLLTNEVEPSPLPHLLAIPISSLGTYCLNIFSIFLLDCFLHH